MKYIDKIRALKDEPFGEKDMVKMYIEKAARKGYNNCFIDFSIGENVRNWLLEEGFRIKGDGDYIYIGW